MFGDGCGFLVAALAGMGAELPTEQALGKAKPNRAVIKPMI